MLQHVHNPVLVVLSIAIAIFASYTALDLVNSVTLARGRRVRLAWLFGGSLAMGVGIWSMHFIAMLAFSVPGVPIAYNIFLLILSILVAIAASAMALFIVSRGKVTTQAYVFGGLVMGAAISGMHYIGIASMRMGARFEWNDVVVVASIAIAVVTSFAALLIAFRLREDVSRRGFLFRSAGGIVMGFGISGMHYTAMAAMRLYPAQTRIVHEEQILATSGLAVAVIGTTLLILGIALTGCVVDRALARKQASTDKISRILESISDAFFSVDRSWRFSYLNRVALETFQQVFGKNPAKLRGKTLWEAIPEFLGSEFEKTFRCAMKNGSPLSIEEYFPTFDAWFEAQAYPSVDGLSVYFRDVTIKRNSEERVKEALRSRDEFIALASHELKTPIASMKLKAQLAERLIKKEAAYEKLGELMHAFSRQLDRLVRIVEDMLDISRISSGKLTVEFSENNLSNLVSEILESQENDCIQAGCTIHAAIDLAVTGVFDAFRMEQVVINLLSNSIKYAAGKPIEISLKKTGPELARLTVRDYGIGIPKEAQPYIFNRFERAASAKNISGLGLGLYIVKSIVDAHHGTISVESTPGEGALFTVNLPLAQQNTCEKPQSLAG